MKTIWCFGDSFTEDFSLTNPYTLYKGYKPKTHPQIIGERLGINWVNLGKGGASNYEIIETISENISKIKSDDIISIGWSNVIRFRLAESNKQIWQSLQPSMGDANRTNVSLRTIEETLLNRESELYKVEIQNWINLLRYTFKDNIVVNWTWSHIDWKYLKETKIFDKFESITMCTNGEIIDSHWSEKGHEQFADWFVNTIQKSNYTNVLINSTYI